MIRIKQSTALEWDFYAMDTAGAGVTGKVDGDWTKRIKKSGGSFGALTITVTELENGWYKITISSSHTDTLGCLSLSFSATGVVRVNLQFVVDARLIDDLPTAAQIADAVWDEAIAGHVSAGSTGEALNDAGVGGGGGSPSLFDTANIYEPDAPFTWPASPASILGWIGALARNKVTVTGGTMTLRNDDDDATIATSAATDNAGVTTRPEWS